MAIEMRPYDIGCEPSPSVPAETLVQDGWKTYLLFWAVSKAVDASGFLKDLGVAILECQHCAMSKFGYPNDEGLPEHPLYRGGIDRAESSVLEVIDSSWVAEVSDQMAASARRIWGARYDEAWSRRGEQRHFVLTLKEVTFECVASRLAVVAYCATFDEAFANVISRLNEN